MNDDLSIQTNEAALCGACYHTINDADAFCDSCGYPVKGTLEQQQAFVDNKMVKEIDLEDYNAKIKNAGNKLFWVAGIFAISGFALYATGNNAEEKTNTLIGCLIISLIFVALGAWSRKKPLAALISGAALYGIVLILGAIENPLSIISGIIWKVIIIGAFIKGIKAAIEADKLKKELNIE
ncbi:hypothetical protein KXQ82_07250 [Mucilaginibacter sp. HMF5004]|uniref:hypothetical protein n=1 Tax=Mucilaginibacter rivuli TaxID=2857527 RepID=UPI001C5D30EB|nr:hypothetical protein [Mucilaginibacter rivuli]MBW4889504.1 hypothetical protein [Mucilaginibacter rivuli]